MINYVHFCFIALNHSVYVYRYQYDSRAGDNLSFKRKTNLLNGLKDYISSYIIKLDIVCYFRNKVSEARLNCDLFYTNDLPSLCSGAPLQA